MVSSTINLISRSHHLYKKKIGIYNTPKIHNYFPLTYTIPLFLRVIWQKPGFLFVLSLASRTQPKFTKQNHHKKHKTQTQRPINTQTKVLVSLSYLIVLVLQPRPQPPAPRFHHRTRGLPSFRILNRVPKCLRVSPIRVSQLQYSFFLFSPELLLSHSTFWTSKKSLHFRYSIFFSNSLVGFDFELWDWFYSTNLVFVLAALLGAS